MQHCQNLALMTLLLEAETWNHLNTPESYVEVIKVKMQ